MKEQKFSLHDRIDETKRLLDKYELEKHLIEVSSSRQPSLEKVLIQKRYTAELERAIRKLHVADLAILLETIPHEKRMQIWSLVPDARRGEVLLELSDAVLESIVEGTPHDALVAALRELDPDDLSYIKDAIPEPAFRDALNTLTMEERDFVHTSITYPEDCAGHLITSDTVVIHPEQNLSEVQTKLRATREFTRDIEKIFVVDNRGHFVGALFLTDILVNEPDTLVRDVMKEKVVNFHPEDRLDDVALAFERYDLVSAPVINDRGKLLGRLKIETVMDYVRESTQLDALNVVGVVESEDLFAKIWDSARNRWLWLGINLVTAFIISRVIGAFEHTIGQLVALASLMPIIASVAGNTGNQTTALVIRSIALNQLHGGNIWHVLRKEVTISLLNGVVWGLLVGLFSYLFYQNPGLSLVVTVAMVLSFLLAAILGVSAPIFLHHIGRDPAMGASVILTGMIDALGFFVFLLLASLFLV